MFTTPRTQREAIDALLPSEKRFGTNLQQPLVYPTRLYLNTWHRGSLILQGISQRDAGGRRYPGDRPVLVVGTFPPVRPLTAHEIQLIPKCMDIVLLRQATCEEAAHLGVDPGFRQSAYTLELLLFMNYNAHGYPVLKLGQQQVVYFGLRQ